MSTPTLILNRDASRLVSSCEISISISIRFASFPLTRSTTTTMMMMMMMMMMMISVDQQ
jgi:hypothetical protein